MRENRWHVDIFIDKHEDKTRAQARLRNPDDPGPVHVRRSAQLNDLLARTLRELG